MSLAVAPCRDLCDWSPQRGPVADVALFACAGCGSQWEPSQAWTPRQADGTVPAAVLSAVRGAAAGSGGS